jgi:hypothetical protein
LAITDRELVYTVDPEVWGAQIHDYAAISAYYLGMKNIALEQGTIAANMAPDDLRIHNNLLLYQAGDVQASDAGAT